MSAASDLLTRAEANCADEPVHRPGAIQPHGILLALRNGEVVGRSANVDARSLDDLLRPDDAARVSGARAPDTIEVLTGRDGRVWSGLLSRRHGSALTLLELEPAVAAGTEPLRRLNAAILDLQNASDLAAACTAGAAAVAGMTGFDRVMVYRFLPDWSGDVLAEIRSHGGIQSFKGLRFPSTDIPPQARALYASARVRSIPDRAAAVVPLEGVDPALDLSNCTLRAVSPLHLQYLANMGVQASMSVAILTTDGVLWGLIACHNESGPLFVGHDVRHAADTLARALAWRIAELGAAELAAGRARLGTLREALLAQAAEPATPFAAIVEPLAGRMRDLALSDAFAIVGPESPFDPDAHGPALAGALDTAAPHGRFATDRLAEGAPAMSRLTGFCGLLAHRIVEGPPGTWAVWLRRELRGEVEWAGDPDKQVVVPSSGLPSLSPRHSFAIWRETVQNRSRPFSSADDAAAATLAEELSRALLQRADAIGRINRELRERNEEIRFFADAAVHDLREPLWQIQVFAGMLREDLASVAAADDLSNMAQIVESSAVRMREMIDELSQFATVGRRPSQLDAEVLDAIVGDAVADLGEGLRTCNGMLEVDCVDLSLRCDRGQIRRLFQNLLSNAIKYRGERPLVIRIAAEPMGAGRIRIAVADNGRGFAPADRERIFEPFRRLADTGTDGMGLGLAICRRIVEGHGGTIEATAVPDEGARFVIELPTEGPSA